MTQIVASNPFLNDRATSLRTLLNTGHFLRLYQNNLDPTPATLFLAFSEASFTGYHRVVLTNAFGAPVKVLDGVYQITTPVYTFTCTAGAPQTIYGCLVDDNLTVKLSYRFPAPIIMTSGGSFTLQFSPQAWALSIL